MRWPGAKRFAKCFWLLQIPGSLSLWFYFHPFLSLGRNSQEHCKCCCTVWKSGRNHRSKKFISIVTGSKPSRLPVEWVDLIHSSKHTHKCEWHKEVNPRVQRNSELRHSGRVPSPNEEPNMILTRISKTVASFLCFEGGDSSSHSDLQSPRPLRQTSPLKASLLNQLGPHDNSKSWPPKPSMLASMPQKGFDRAFPFNVQHFSHSYFPWASHALVLRRFICLLIHSFIHPCN